MRGGRRAPGAHHSPDRAGRPYMYSHRKRLVVREVHIITCRNVDWNKVSSLVRSLRKFLNFLVATRKLQTFDVFFNCNQEPSYKIITASIQETGDMHWRCLKQAI